MHKTWVIPEKKVIRSQEHRPQARLRAGGDELPFGHFWLSCFLVAVA